MKIVFYLFVLMFPLFSEELLKPVSILIPMRDGFELPADVYLPYLNAKNLPCILIRSPSGQTNPYAQTHLDLLKEGYVVVIQATRSNLDKEGKTLPYLSDGWGELQDGYDTLAYLAKSPYSNGKIGTVGASALGITQLMVAPTNPPSLVAQYISFAASDLYHQGIYQSGDLFKHQVEGWLSIYAKHPEVYRKVFTEPTYNEFWDQFNMLSQAKNCHVPGLHVGGWYDTFLKGTLESYQALQHQGGEGAKGNQRLVIGPWSHLWPLIQTFGEYSYHPNVKETPYDYSTKEWFAYHLKEEKNPLKPLPTVMYYVMGPLNENSSSGNCWKEDSHWPISHKKTKLYLQKDQTLGLFLSKDSTFSYLYDPNNPIPTLGGRNLFLPSGPFDQSLIENRKDLLVFTTETLENDLEVTGNLLVSLFVSTNREDTSFSARLTDVYPDGKSLLIADGMTRLSVNKKPDATPPHEIEIDLLATSMVFAKGHKIRLIVSSSNYPRYEKNFNSLKRAHENPEPLIAENTIYLGPNYPSHLLLPVISPR